MNLAQWIAAILIALVIFVNLLNPGGWIIALIMIAAILVAYGALEFFPEYLLVTNQGKNARKDKRRKRRSRGLNPFSRKRKRTGDSSSNTRETNGSESRE